MKLNKGQFTRQASDETDQSRTVNTDSFAGTPQAGFCEVTGKWSSNLVEVNGQMVCKTAAARIAELSVKEKIKEEQDRLDQESDEAEETKEGKG